MNDARQRAGETITFDKSHGERKERLLEKDTNSESATAFLKKDLEKTGAIRIV